MHGDDRMKNEEQSQLALGNKAFREGRYEEALKCYERVVISYPQLEKIISNNIIMAKNKLLSSVSKSNTYSVLYGEDTFFNEEYYLKNNLDVVGAKIKPEEHYRSFGEKEGRRPNPYFDPLFYANVNPDVRVSGVSLLDHYRTNGKAEGRLSQSSRKYSIKKISKNKKTLLFVGHDGILAGAQVVLLEIIRWFSQHTNRRIKLLLLGPGLMSTLYAEHAEVYALSGEHVDDVQSFKEFISEDFEFIYVNTVVSGRFFKITNFHNILLTKNVIVNIHEMEKVLTLFEEELNELIKQAKHWISGSPESTKVLVKKYGIDSNKVTTIPAFIRPLTDKNAHFNELKGAVRSELCIAADVFVVVGCGNVHWRKGVDIFLDTARRVKEKTSAEIKFIWIGEGEDRESLEASIATHEKEYIIFLGHRTDADRLIAAADVFYLPSREDPFPLVVLLAAQHFIPSICFSKTTGITEFIKDDAGVCLDELSSVSASLAINELIDDRDKLISLGIVAKNRVFAEYTAESKVSDIYSVISKHTNYKPSVSVIVPFFNHEKFVYDRIKSIVNQTIKDIQIILMDDASDDKTASEISALYLDSRFIFIKNATNSGTPFLQWKKGVELSVSDLVWIAEGDDSCSFDFLEHLLPYFDDPLVTIAAAKTEMIDEAGVNYPDAFKNYFDEAFPEKFEAHFIRTGKNEVNDQFGAISTLINASGLIIRKKSIGKNINRACEFKICGDWLIYLECLKHGKLAYDIKPRNYFRRHSNSQVSVHEGKVDYFRERYEITKYVLQNYDVRKSLIVRAIEAVHGEFDRFHQKHKCSKFLELYNYAVLLELARSKSKSDLPSLAVVASDLSPGGGQMFSIRLANAWKSLGGTVILLNVAKFPDHPETLKKIDVDVPVYRVSDIDLKEVLDIYDVDVIHSAIWWSDKYVHEHVDCLASKVRWVLTMHGCYETLIQNNDIDTCFLSYFQKMQYEVDQWVYTADKHKKCFDMFEAPPKLSKVLNGYEPELPNSLSSSSLMVREGSFVVCLASRAIASKGWLAAVNAVAELNSSGHKVDLLLIGEGNAADEIRKSCDTSYIHLLGHVSNLSDYINISDVCILPTSFVGESMPLVLIEFLAQSKPIITTRVGDIVDMTSDEYGSSAIYLGDENGVFNTDELAKHILCCMINNSLLQELSENSRRMFSKFTMEKMIESYTKIYRDCLAGC